MGPQVDENRRTHVIPRSSHGRRRRCGSSPSFDALECRTMLAAGSIQFSTAAFSVADTAGTVPIVMTRTGGSTGAVSVTLATSDGTAVAGTDYNVALGLSQFPRRRDDRAGEPGRPSGPGRQPSRPDGEPDLEQPFVALRSGALARQC